MEVSRRRILGGMVLTGFVALPGCAAGSNENQSDVEVIAGPDGRFEFEPAEITISAGDTVRWEFDSPGHNVSGRPEDSDEVVLPDGAEPFSSYAPDKSHLTFVPEGGTYDHTFEVAGEYVYLCTPHVAAGMIGRVTVST